MAKRERERESGEIMYRNRIGLSISAPLLLEVCDGQTERLLEIDEAKARDEVLHVPLFFFVCLPKSRR